MNFCHRSKNLYNHANYLIRILSYLTVLISQYKKILAVLFKIFRHFRLTKILFLEKKDNNRYIGIDIGINNLVTVANNVGDTAFIINGRALKSICYTTFACFVLYHFKKSCKRYLNKVLIVFPAKIRFLFPFFIFAYSKYLLILTNQNCKIREDKISFPKVFHGFSIQPKFLRSVSAFRILSSSAYLIHLPLEINP